LRHQTAKRDATKAQTRAGEKVGASGRAREQVKV
jgi:hypothetical protein